MSVRHKGSLQVQRQLDFYNLDLIISDGYLEDLKPAAKMLQAGRKKQSSKRKGSKQ
jgi:hypothetical protein